MPQQVVSYQGLTAHKVWRKVFDDHFQLCSSLAAMGYVKQIQGVQKKSLNVTNCSRILQSYSDSWTDPKTSGVGGREFLARRCRLANQNTSRWNVLRRNLSAVLVLKRRLISWFIARNPQTPFAQTNTIQQEDVIIMPERIPEQNQVYCTCSITRI